MLTTIHEPVGGLSIEVGRFIGALNQENYIELNKSRITEVIELSRRDVRKVALMSDGAYNKWKE